MYQKDFTYYTFTSFDEDSFYQYYSNYYLEKQEYKRVEEEMLTMDIMSPNKGTTPQTSPKAEIPHNKLVASKETILYKTLFFMDWCIRSSFKNDKGIFKINAEILKNTIGNDYKPVLDYFTENNYLKILEYEQGYIYQPYKHSTRHTVNAHKEISVTERYNHKIEKLQERLKQNLSSLHHKQITKLYTLLGKKNTERYISSLKDFTITNKQGYNDFVKSASLHNKNTYPYYKWLYKELINSKDRTIYKTDKSNRVYHLLTSLKREVKQFLNIKFSLDCKNSHPLLYNYFIFQFNNIPTELSIKISEIFKEDYNKTSNYHHPSKYFRNILINNNIESYKIDRISDNELDYIYKTTNGLLWNEFNDLNPDLDRTEIKQEMFKQVFYSNRKGTYVKPYAKIFRNKYGRVYKSIENWKEYKKHPHIKTYIKKKSIYSNKETSYLPNAMMKLESEIFCKVLKKLFKAKYKAIHIHDAIVVPDTRVNDSLEPQFVESIMSDVFKEYGLSPTFSIE